MNAVKGGAVLGVWAYSAISILVHGVIYIALTEDLNDGSAESREFMNSRPKFSNRDYALWATSALVGARMIPLIPGAVKSLAIAGFEATKYTVKAAWNGAKGAYNLFNFLSPSR